MTDRNINMLYFRAMQNGNVTLYQLMMARYVLFPQLWCQKDNWKSQKESSQGEISQENKLHTITDCTMLFHLFSNTKSINFNCHIVMY